MIDSLLDDIESSAKDLLLKVDKLRTALSEPEPESPPPPPDTEPEHPEVEYPITMLSATQTGENQVALSWTHNIEGALFDFQYRRPDDYKKDKKGNVITDDYGNKFPVWPHSYQKYKNVYILSDHDNEPVYIGNLGTGKWEGKAVGIHGDWELPDIEFEIKTEPDETPELTPVRYNGFWNHAAGDDHGKAISKDVTMLKTMSVDEIELVMDQNLPMVVHIGRPSSCKTEVDWKKRLEGKKKVLDFYREKYAVHILFLNLLDEPYNPFFQGSEKIEQWVDIAKEVFGTDYEIGISYKRLSIGKPERPIATNLDRVGINFYPDRDDNKGQVSDEEYKQLLRGYITASRARSNAKLFIVCQGFYGAGNEDKYDVPRTNAPQLIQQVMNEMDVDMAIWFTYESEYGYLGTATMPGLYQNIIKMTQPNGSN